MPNKLTQAQIPIEKAVEKLLTDSPSVKDASAILLKAIEKDGAKITLPQLYRLVFTGLSVTTIISIVGGLGTLIWLGYFVHSYLNPPTVSNGSKVATPPAITKIDRRKPDFIRVRSVDYWAAGYHGSWLDGLGIHLEEEGEAERKMGKVKAFLTLIATTYPLPQATPELVVQVSPAYARFSLTGCAFRRHSSDGHQLYEPLLAEIRQGKLSFTLPESEQGDSILLALRLSSEAEDRLPKVPDLPNVLVVSIHEKLLN
jgi:hypothetical protein